MPKRRLVLNRETLVSLDPDDLSAVVAGAVSKPHPLCELVTSPQFTCRTCGVACTVDCPSDPNC
jgi:hypothetical protein